MRTASQRSDVDPFLVMEVVREAFAREARGAATYHLEVGQPGSPAPAAVRARVSALLEQGAALGYTQANGLPAFRSALAAHYLRQQHLSIDPQRIVATAGSSAGFLLSFLAAFDVGDRVALARPGYPAYRNSLAALGLDVVELEGRASDRFQPTPALIEAEIARNGPLQGLIVASPANPTGAVLSEGEQRALLDCCQQHGIRLLADEIYHGLSYEQPTRSFAALSDEVIVLNSFSKYFCMTGWRIGWLVLPPTLVRPIERLGQNLFICPPAIAQEAAIAALTPAADQELAALLAGYARNRRRLTAAVTEAALGPFVAPQGAFYLYVDISRSLAARRLSDSVAWCRQLLEATGVAATPGIDFDRQRGGNWVRFSFCADEATIEAACRLLTDWARSKS